MGKERERSGLLVLWHASADSPSLPHRPPQVHTHTFLDSSVLPCPLFASAPLLVAFMFHVQDLRPPPSSLRVYTVCIRFMCPSFFLLFPFIAPFFELPSHHTERNRHAHTHTNTCDFQNSVRSCLRVLLSMFCLRVCMCFTFPVLPLLAVHVSTTQQTAMSLPFSFFCSNHHPPSPSSPFRLRFFRLCRDGRVRCR